MTSDISIHHHLRQCYLFEGLSDTALDALAQQTQITHVAKGAVLFLSGDEADGLRIVTKGLLRVWINDAEGREITLSLSEPGDAIGEIALLDGAPRSASVTAMDKSEVLLIRRASFQALLRDHSELSAHMIEILCERLRSLTDHLGEVALLPLRERVARKLFDLAQSHATPEGKGARFRRSFSQSELAAMLGVTREAVNKQIAGLTSEGILGKDAGRLVILDLDALGEAGGGD